MADPDDVLDEVLDKLDDYGLARGGEWLAPDGFDFARWHFERECAARAELHDLGPDDAFALYTLVQLYDQMSVLLIDADADEPLDNALAAASEDAESPEPGRFGDQMGELGAALADPLLAELLLAETVGTCRDGAAALGLFAEVLEPKVPRATRVACRWLRAVALERIGDIDAAERELLAAESMDPDWPLPLFDLARIASDRGEVERGLSLLTAPTPRRTTRSWSCSRRTGPSRAATSAATSRAGAGPAASTRNAISEASSCRWPSGRIGCIRRPAGTRC